MKKNTCSTLLGSVLFATGVTVALMAAPPKAAPASNQTTAICNVNNVSLGGINATACKGPFDGNDTGAQGTLLSDLNNGLFKNSLSSDYTYNWALAGKSDESNNFLTAANNFSSGAWSLKQPLSSDTFVLSLKTSTAYSAYLFTGINYTNLQGFFNTVGVALAGNGNQGKALSHASLFVATKKHNEQPPVKKVPEPGTLLGLGLTATGMVVSRRRKSN
ncbi:PEP-CTERM sorting domain-containing protein [Scytonema hofmannii PCC 7110]|uniref:PEP-CTERM sorting domain-containing protein n=1 Tax=Scytonema hofmannii PCC 7110 TaxID=128403 RepID=A0A139XB28_9CYAN|nr:PEP-CTERM sorting domain-containing protein [Scytonema hofmannii]KYC41908.1 PEP-CTERM sorting domain-containing protein [Scytonema hofmannii PCC 7110]